MFTDQWPALVLAVVMFITSVYFRFDENSSLHTNLPNCCLASLLRSFQHEFAASPKWGLV